MLYEVITCACSLPPQEMMARMALRLRETMFDMVELPTAPDLVNQAVLRLA